ncbi:MAG: class I SAM-dependent methyltransferase [bacterium]|nr:class I SAM-dependent methyltransferase [bacterium]
MFILFGLGTIFFIILIIFSFPQFSPIPYFPSNKKDLKLILKSLKIKNDQTIIDLGAGDGMIIFEAAKYAFEKELNTQFIATEINPILLSIMFLRRLFHKNKNNIKILYADMFTMNYHLSSIINHPSLTFYLYISPWFLDKTVLNIKKQIKKYNIVSYMYQIPSLKNIENKSKGNIHDIFTYTI